MFFFLFFTVAFSFHYGQARARRELIPEKRKRFRADIFLPRHSPLAGRRRRRRRAKKTTPSLRAGPWDGTGGRWRGGGGPEKKDR